MARKLKSDKVLFITTILLVALSVVMVYSASAPVALERYGRASRYLITQGMWAALGIAMLSVVMRIDYRCYREPVFIWTCLALVSVALIGVYFRAPINGARRWFGVGGIGVQPSELAKLVAIFFIAANLERRGRRIDDLAVRRAADRHRRPRAGRADPAGTRLRHVDDAAADRRRHGLRRGPELSLHRRLDAAWRCPPCTSS